MSALDRISELPDDVLLHILSLLTFRESTRTKTLSTRWRRLDTGDVVVSLQCPFPLRLQRRKKGGSYGYLELGVESHFSSYMNLVNRALDHHNGMNKVIKKFRVDIPYTQEEKGSYNINKLLGFALSRETEIVDIRAVYSTSFTRTEYTSLLKKSSINNKNNGFLKELSLTGVRLVCSDIRVLLSSLVALERLLLESSGVDLYIDGPPTSKLKHLIVSNSNMLWRVNYYDEFSGCISGLRNLVSLCFDGMEAGAAILLSYLPKLLYVRVRGEVDLVAALKSKSFPSVGYDESFPTIDYGASTRPEHVEFFVRLNHEQTFSYCCRLKHLEMKVVVNDESCDLHNLFGIIEECPKLKMLEIKLIWAIKPKYKKKKQRFMVDEERVDRVAKIDYLRTLKLSEFCGSLSELEFVWCVINNGGLLEELILEASATKCATIQREIANSFKHFRAFAPTSLDLVLGGIPLSNLM